MNPKSLLCGIPVVSVLLLWACQTASLQAGLAEQESRWFNVTDFGAVDDIGTSPYDLEFDITYSGRSEEHTSELQSRGHLVCRLLLEKKKNSIQFMSATSESSSILSRGLNTK